MSKNRSTVNVNLRIRINIPLFFKRKKTGNTFNTKINLNYVENNSSYLTENTVRHHYDDKINSCRTGKNRCLFPGLYKT